MGKYKSKRVKSKRLKSKRLKSKRVKSKSKYLRGGAAAPGGSGDPELNALVQRLKKLNPKAAAKLQSKKPNTHTNNAKVDVGEWKQKSLIPFLQDQDSFELFIRRYEGKLKHTCGLKYEQYDELLAVAINFDDNRENLIDSVDEFTDELIRICGVKTIDCLGV